MSKKWFQHNEVMAGAKRLILSYYLYKIFGSFSLRLIAFFVGTGAFLTANERRHYSKRFFSIISEFENKNYPPLLSSYKHFLNYADSLADKVISFTGKLSASKFYFKDGDSKEISEYIKNNKGIFFLTTHIGNVEILRSLLQDKNAKKPAGINIFLEKKSCEVFNNFLERVNIKNSNITTYPVEEIEMQTAIELSEKLENGEFIFMAGDRISKNNPDKTYEAKLFNKTINLPLGAVKLSQILKSPVFFIVCAKEKNHFNIHSKKFIPTSKNKKEILEQLQKEYGAFLEKYAIRYPYQFFHFYNLFETN